MPGMRVEMRRSATNPRERDGNSGRVEAVAVLDWWSESTSEVGPWQQNCGESIRQTKFGFSFRCATRIIF